MGLLNSKRVGGFKSFSGPHAAGCYLTKLQLFFEFQHSSSLSMLSTQSSSDKTQSESMILYDYAVMLGTAEAAVHKK